MHMLIYGHGNSMISILSKTYLKFGSGFIFITSNYQNNTHGYSSFDINFDHHYYCTSFSLYMTHLLEVVNNPAKLHDPTPRDFKVSEQKYVYYYISENNF